MMGPDAVIIDALLIWLAAIVSPAPNPVVVVVVQSALAGSRRSAFGVTSGIALPFAAGLMVLLDAR